MRGCFILFEGIDRAGKTSQAKLLVKSLNELGIKSEYFVFPDRSTTIGGMISNYLKETLQLRDQVIHLLYSANRWEKEGEIMERLNAGVTVVADRYAHSGVVFTASKGYDMEWCEGPDRGLPSPDSILYLDLSIEEAKKRGGYGNERYEKEEFQREVKQQYELLRSRGIQRGEKDWININADQSFEDVSKDVLKHALEQIELSKHQPILKLWIEQEKRI